MSLLGRWRGRKPKVAALTMVRDEAAMLPRWVGYYGAQLGVDHLVVIDHGSSDGSTDDLPCRVIRNPELDGPTFERARMRLLTRVARDLLRDHDAVVFTDCDEFLVADPERYGGLRDYVAANPDRQVTGGLGFNVVHRADREPALRPDLPVLGQRRSGMFIQRLCKPSLKRVDAKWRFASHGIEAPYEPDPALLLVHLKYADAEHLRSVGDQRFAVREAAGLTQRSAWAMTGADQVQALAEVVAGPDEPPVFDPTSLDPATLVRTRGGAWEAGGVREFEAMRQGPLLQLPERFLGLV
ncbi:glycosyltransferase family 2 protein [Nocardioides sp. CER19]|uniref:glycosyltransferase family 2 protein n=1 Tax=Nocardioides sp. CER19 TaxID=3038538 RepID=UPI002448AC2C|nr:glycosyltransferase family 2 protein [Nocardioides sp. CER19]MDH2415150.1 glycosyltransferase family 2 protein [Nocardioides sp. CER19]